MVAFCKATGRAKLARAGDLMREGALPIVAFVAVAASKAAAAGLHAVWPEGGALSVDAVLSISVRLRSVFSSGAPSPRWPCWKPGHCQRNPFCEQESVLHFRMAAQLPLPTLGRKRPTRWPQVGDVCCQSRVRRRPISCVLLSSSRSQPHSQVLTLAGPTRTR